MRRSPPPRISHWVGMQRAKISLSISAQVSAIHITAQDMWSRERPGATSLSSEASRAAAVAAGDTAAESREDFFAQADVLSLHLRLSDKTRGIVTAQDLARMKPTALFVNTSRAELVADGALEAALPQGRPGAAALDVFTDEPLPPTSPLLQLPNVLATPHLGYVERDGYELYFSYALQNIVDFARRPANCAPAMSSPG